MKILVINAGSSSLKYQLIDMDNEQWVAKGNFERIGLKDSIIGHKTADGFAMEETAELPTHKEALELCIQLLTTGEHKVVESVKEISAIGHRVVHGGEEFSKATYITDEVIEKVIALGEFAPLHNPAQGLAMKACRNVVGPDVPMVVVFDTAFHQTMPKEAFLFGVPYDFYEKYGARRYGFHGTSHRYLTARYAELVGKRPEDTKIITCHMGNGSSLAAIKGGKVIDTSMGFTPLDGFIMGTRSGSVDPSLVLYLMEKENLSPAEMSTLLNKKSGLLGLSGVSGDMRDVRKGANEGNERCQMAIDILCYQVKRYIGAYAAAMNGVDAIIFAGGIGENERGTRLAVTSGLDYLGVKVDPEKNENASGKEMCISAPGATTDVWVIPTNEEIMIARDTKAVVEAL